VAWGGDGVFGHGQDVAQRESQLDHQRSSKTGTSGRVTWQRSPQAGQ
jgi:hypothetical protein